MASKNVMPMLFMWRSTVTSEYPVLFSFTIVSASSVVDSAPTIFVLHIVSFAQWFFVDVMLRLCLGLVNMLFISVCALWIAMIAGISWSTMCCGGLAGTGDICLESGLYRWAVSWD